MKETPYFMSYCNLRRALVKKNLCKNRRPWASAQRTAHGVQATDRAARFAVPPTEAGRPAAGSAGFARDGEPSPGRAPSLAAPPGAGPRGRGSAGLPVRLLPGNAGPELGLCRPRHRALVTKK